MISTSALRQTSRNVIIAVLSLCSAAASAGTPQTTKLSLPQLDIPAITLVSTFDGPHSGVFRTKTSGQAAYNYSVYLFFDSQAKIFRMYCGGRWKSKLGDGDHIFQYTSITGRGETWRPQPGGIRVLHNGEPIPQFLKGAEEGLTGRWFSGNCMDPRVFKVKGVYYLYTQVEIHKNSAVDTGQLSTQQADRIQLHTSKDGIEWNRFSEKRGVIVNIAEPAATGFDHEEVLYVPWDDRPFWMYVHTAVNGKFIGHVRIRSTDPTSFDFSQYEKVGGLSELGNQMGYIHDAPGGPLFLRITYAKADDRTAPAIQFSRDGLRWTFGENSATAAGRVCLAGSDDTDKLRNTYFLGISTVDGTGELPAPVNGHYRFIYGATTCDRPVAPDIFHSQIGVGQADLSFGS